MSDRPILFSGAMVRALLAGTKTQTRRVVKPQPGAHCKAWEKDGLWKWLIEDTGMGVSEFFRCPYGAPGDRLFVRENGWERVGASGTFDPYYFDASMKEEEMSYLREHATRFRRRPSIHMPRRFCRLVLEVTAVRVARLQDISEADVVAEGLNQHEAAAVVAAKASKFKTVPEHWIGGHDEGLSYCRPCAEKQIAELSAAKPSKEFTLDGGWRTEGDSQAFCETCTTALGNSYTDYCCGEEIDHFERNGFDVTSPGDCHSLDEILATTLWTGGKHSAGARRLAYRALWDSLNAKRGFGWATNPWVWVVESRRAV